MKRLKDLTGAKLLNRAEQKSINGGTLSGSCSDRICKPICGSTGGTYLYTEPNGHICCGCC